MKLELVSKGSNVIGANRGKPSQSASSNPWKGKYNRRKYPRDSESNIDIAPVDKSAANNR